MDDEKKDLKGFLKSIKNKARDQWVSYGKLWTKRIFEYNVLAILFSFVGTVLFAYFNLFHTDANSARYMLSALVQSQAAIVAIVVSLTLIAVQLSASAYSPRVIRIFRNNPDVWLLLALYGHSIFYGLLILKTIRDGDLREISLFNYPIEIHIICAYFLGIFSFLMLFRYILSIIDLLNPVNIINRLTADITKDAILKPKEDPIQPIMDIVHGSIMRYDIATMRVGLKAVTERVIEIIDSDGEKEISERFCTHLERVSKLAISKEDEEAALEVVNNLGKFGRSTAENRFEDATTRALSFLNLIGRIAAEKELEYTTLMVALNLGGIGRIAAEKELERAATAAVSSLGEVGRTAAVKRIKNLTTTAVSSLGEIGSKTAEKGFVNATKWAVESLHAIGEIAVEKELKEAIFSVVMHLKTVGIAAAKNNLKDATQQAALALVAVRMSATKKGFERVTEIAAVSLAELTLLNEEFVKTAIRGYESNIVEQDRESFQRFKQLYEQKLKELRSEKKNTE